MKTLSLPTIVFAVLLAMFMAIASYIQFADAGSYFISPAISASKSQRVTVGPQSNVQILATGTRSYAQITRDTLNAAVYCNANGDRLASTTVTGGVSFKLSTSSGEVYEFGLEKNPYDGAVRCTATASTTIIVFELKRR